MTITVANYKGGVGKSTIAMSYAVSRNLKLVTNDLSSQYDNVGITDYVKLPENKKRIPPELLHSDNTVYDLGAMNGKVDHKILDAIKHSEALIVPTLTDQRSLEATIQFINDAKQYVDTIIVVINRTSMAKKNLKDYEYAKALISTVIPPTHIKLLKESTLYSRIAKHGFSELTEVQNEHGVRALRKAVDYQYQLFNEIDELIIAGNRIY